MEPNNPVKPIPIASDTADAKSEQKFAGKDADAVKIDISQDIDPANEVQGARLVLIHLAICLCTFLVGLVSVSVPVRTRND